MDNKQLQASGHAGIRTILRLGGPITAGIGLLFVAIGLASFFMAFGSFGPPRYFWCAFVGMPMLFVGGVMCMFGYIGDAQRYLAGESAPVAKDVVNYMGENTQPGVKAVSKAVAEGIIEAQKEQRMR